MIIYYSVKESVCSHSERIYRLLFEALAMLWGYSLMQGSYLSSPDSLLPVPLIAGSVIIISDCDLHASLFFSLYPLVSSYILHPGLYPRYHPFCFL